MGGNYCSARASASFAADLRKDLYHRVQAFSFANLDTYTTGSLVTRLTNDVTQLQNVIRMALIMLLRAPGMLIGAVIMAVSINAELAVVVALVIPVLMVGLAVVIRVGFPRFTRMQRKIDALNSTIQEGLTNIRVIKSFVRGNHEIHRFHKANDDLKQTALSAMNVVIFAMPLMMAAMNFTTLAVVWFGGQKVIAGGMLVGDLTAFTTYVVQILMSLMMLSMILLQSSRALASARRITEVLETNVDLTDENAARKDRQVQKGRVEFRHVSFRYYKNREEKVLDDISFTAEPGETVGIIGSTGAGKTTITNLLTRFYDISEGSIQIDGVDVRQYQRDSLREQIAMVLQDTHLFTGTVRENIRYGRLDATDEEVEEAAHTASAHSFIMRLSDGYDTMLTGDGANLSQGQRQLLNIARASLSKAPILVLDEATSSVDTRTEKHIEEGMDRLMQNRTTFVIAHRLSTVRHADCIYVLEQGEILEHGNHEELLARRGRYYELYTGKKELD